MRCAKRRGIFPVPCILRQQSLTVMSCALNDAQDASSPSTASGLVRLSTAAATCPINHRKVGRDSGEGRNDSASRITLRSDRFHTGSMLNRTLAPSLKYARQVPVAQRAAWMRERLVPCDCALNPYQTLPYEECTYANRGCRQCPAGQFQDDLYSRCTPCGSVCPLGFRAYNASLDAGNAAVKSRYGLTSLALCGPNISTSKALALADPVYDPIAYGLDQIRIGCVPCESGPYNSPQQVVFTLPGCHWVCKRDPTNQTDPDHYCKGPLNALGACDQQCLTCDDSLAALSPPPTLGFYIQPCQARPSLP